jgi:hypothetical protein
MTIGAAYQMRFHLQTAGAKCPSPIPQREHKSKERKFGFKIHFFPHISCLNFRIF